MSRYERTIVVFKVMGWRTGMYHSFFNRYIDRYNQYLPKGGDEFTVEDMLLAAILFTLTAYFHSAGEGLDEMENFLDSYFLDEDERSLMDAGTRFRLTTSLNDMAEIIGADLINAFNDNRLQWFPEEMKIDDVYIRNNAISFVLTDMGKEVW